MTEYRNLNNKVESKINGMMGTEHHVKNGLSVKRELKNICVIFVFVFMGQHIHGQSGQQVYLGPGYGLDYGGIGGKIEYLPIKYFGIYGGLGFNFRSVGWNLGATVKILPDKVVSPNVMVFYGYNKVLIVLGAPEYNMTSYGVTIGANLDIKVGRKGNKLSAGFFVPILSKKYKEHINTKNIKPFFNLPIAFGVGFNFKLNKEKENY